MRRRLTEPAYRRPVKAPRTIQTAIPTERPKSLIGAYTPDKLLNSALAKLPKRISTLCLCGGIGSMPSMDKPGNLKAHSAVWEGVNKGSNIVKIRAPLLMAVA